MCRPQSKIIVGTRSALLATLVFSAAGLAQTPDAAKGLPHLRSISVPNSLDFQIVGYLENEDTTEFYEFAVPDGGSLRLSRGEPVDLAFIFEMINEGRSTDTDLNVYAFEVTADEVVNYTEKITVSPGVREFSDTLQGFSVHVEALYETGSLEEVPAIAKYLRDESLFQSTCCVTCAPGSLEKTITVCGCEVSAHCGSCVSPSCAPEFKY